MLSNQWTVADFYPIEYIPSGVRLTAYGGDAADLPTEVLQAYLDGVAARRLTPDPSHLRARRDRASARRHGGREGHRQARRPPVTQPGAADLSFVAATNDELVAHVRVGQAVCPCAERLASGLDAVSA
jgi:hypothetical protein